MIRCFKQSIFLQYALLVLGTIAAYWDFVSRADDLLIVRITFAVLYVALGAVAGKIAGQVYANTAHKKLVGILLSAGNAQGFIDAYRNLPEKCRKNSSAYILAMNYLAMGYNAAGEHAKAIALLKDLDITGQKYHKSGLNALTFNNLCHFYCVAGNPEPAEEQIQKMTLLSEDTAKTNPVVSKNLNSNIQLYSQYLHYLKEEKPDIEYLKEEIRLSNNKLHQSQVEVLLGRIYMKENMLDEAVLLLTKTANENPGLYTGAVAQTLLANVKNLCN